MNRADVFEVINREREYQDTAWPRDEYRKQMYKYSAPHILLLEKYVKQLADDWVKSSTERNLPATIAKIATIAVRALEEIEFGAVDLLQDGLR